jgi:hypothetical protein
MNISLRSRMSSRAIARGHTIMFVAAGWCIHCTLYTVGRTVTGASHGGSDPAARPRAAADRRPCSPRHAARCAAVAPRHAARCAIAAARGGAAARCSLLAADGAPRHAARCAAVAGAALQRRPVRYLREGGHPMRRRAQHDPRTVCVICRAAVCVVVGGLPAAGQPMRHARADGWCVASSALTAPLCRAGADNLRKGTATKDIHPKQAGGIADAAAHDAFCGSTAAGCAVLRELAPHPARASGPNGAVVGRVRPVCWHLRRGTAHPDRHPLCAGCRAGIYVRRLPWLPLCWLLAGCACLLIAR